MLPHQAGRKDIEKALKIAYQVAVFSRPVDLADFSRAANPLGGVLGWSRKYPLLAYDWGGLPVLHAEYVVYEIDSQGTIEWESLPYLERR
jgi:hypothetical protein